jgi:exodeoxyribonuclease VII small subunit
MKLFEEGMKISKFCSHRLEEAERKVTVLIKRSSGDYQEKPLDTGCEEEDGGEH